MEPLLTTEEVADYLRVDIVTVRRLVNRGELPAYRIGNEYRFMRADLGDFVKRQRVIVGDKTSKEVFDKSTETSSEDAKPHPGENDQFIKCVVCGTLNPRSHNFCISCHERLL